MSSGEEMNVQNVKPRESHIERSVMACIDKIEKSVANVNVQEEDMKWNVVEDFTNPRKEEINQQLTTIPSVQAYYNNMKVYAQLLLDLSEHELYVAQVNAREEYRKAYLDRVANYEKNIMASLKDALRSMDQSKAMPVVKEMVRTMKPKEPTDKEFEMFVKGKTAALEKKVLVDKYRVNKIRDFCKILENKFLAVRALRYSVETMNSSDMSGSKYN